MENIAKLIKHLQYDAFTRTRDGERLLVEPKYKGLNYGGAADLLIQMQEDEDGEEGDYIFVAEIIGYPVRAHIEGLHTGEFAVGGAGKTMQEAIEKLDQLIASLEK